MIRNLTQEAITFAEQELIFQYPQLANEEFRRNLSPDVKMQIFQSLLAIGAITEQELINNITYGRTE